jgi:NAD(P)-dependent dehydrogenase (short-subunit alcohol dehydrogenase family)
MVGEMRSRHRHNGPGNVVVITGAARGLGALLAQRLAAEGMQLALVGLEPELLAEVAGRCGPQARSWTADVTDQAAMTTVAAEIATHYGRVDALVVNAGIAAGGVLRDADPVAFDRVIEVNLLGSVRTTRAFLPHLIQSRGYLLQIASLAALLPLSMMAAYCTSKSGVEAFALAMRGELAHHGVDVGIAYLTWIDTDMVRGADEVSGLRELRASAPFPLNRTYSAQRAVRGLARGVLRRSSRVYVPGWVRQVGVVRPLGAALALRFAKQVVPAAEEELRAAGSTASALVGAGGRADTAYRAGTAGSPAARDAGTAGSVAGREAG